MSRHLTAALLAAIALFGAVDQAPAQWSCTAACPSCEAAPCPGAMGRCRKGLARLAHGGWLRGSACGQTSGGAVDCETGDCGQGGGCHGHRRRIDGLDRHFNCGCNGSYNYPVPPLYTYHWPGMYKQQRTTDYRSPWRFPPIRPYADEVLQPLLEETPPPGAVTLAPVAHFRFADTELLAEIGATPGEIEPLSSKLQRRASR